MTENDDDWRCPGCGKTWEELPVGHSIPVGYINLGNSSGPAPDPTGRCSDVKPMQPWEYMPVEERQ